MHKKTPTDARMCNLNLIVTGHRRNPWLEPLCSAEPRLKTTALLSRAY